MKFRAWINEHITDIMFRLNCGMTVTIREEDYLDNIETK